MAAPICTAGSATIHDCQWPGCPAIATHYSQRTIGDPIFTCRRHMLAFRDLTNPDAQRILNSRQPRTDRHVPSLHFHYTYTSRD